MILKINSNILFLLIALPIFILFKGWIDFDYAKIILFFFPFLIITNWFYSVINYKIINKKHILICILYLLVSMLIPMFRTSVNTFHLDFETIKRALYITLFVFLILHLILVKAAYKRLVQLLPERTKSFMLVELVCTIIAVINITSEIQQVEKEEREKL